MVGVDFDEGQMRRLQDALASVGKSGSKQLSREIVGVINTTAGKTKNATAKELVKNVAVAQKVIKQYIRVDKAKNGIANPHAEVTIHGAFRMPLRDFSAKQNKSGVSYKTPKGTKTIKSAFIVDSMGGHVFIRRGGKVKMTKGLYMGKMRQRIYKLFGPSPIVAALRNNTKPIVIREIEPIFHAQMEERIRTHVRKAMGKY